MFDNFCLARPISHAEDVSILLSQIQNVVNKITFGDCVIFVCVNRKNGQLESIFHRNRRSNKAQNFLISVLVDAMKLAETLWVFTADFLQEITICSLMNISGNPISRLDIFSSCLIFFEEELQEILFQSPPFCQLAIFSIKTNKVDTITKSDLISGYISNLAQQDAHFFHTR